MKLVCLLLSPAQEQIAWTVSILTAVVCVCTAYLRLFVFKEMAHQQEKILTAVKAEHPTHAAVTNQLSVQKEEILGKVGEDHPSHDEVEIVRVTLQGQIDGHTKDITQHDGRLGKLETTWTGH